MAYNPKYQMRFNDLLGGSCQVILSFKDYVGEVTPIIGGSKPVKITFKGDEDNLYDPIHMCKAQVNVYQPPIALIEDLLDIDDTTVQVTITAPNRRYDGYLVPDNIVRPMDLTASSLTLDVVDIFSIMKGKMLVDVNGKIPYGKQTLRWYLERCLALGTADGFGYGITFVNDYYISDAGLQLLDDIFFDASSFKEDDGRPQDCYTIVERLAKGFFSTVYFAEGTLYFITPVSIDTNTYRNIATMTKGMQSEFLVGNLESLGAIRGSHEISCKYAFGRNNGLLKNFNFGDWSGGLPNEWYYEAPTRKVGETNYIMPEKIGTGRPESPYGIAIRSNIFKSDGRWFYFTSSLRQEVNVIKGASYSINIKYIFADYSKWYNKQVERNPRITVNIFLNGVSGSRFVYYNQRDNGDPAGIYFGGAGKQGWWIYPSPSGGGQSANVTIPPIPESGTLQIFVESVDLDGDAYRPDLHPERSKVQFQSVVLSEFLNGQSGIKDYLTQSRSYTQLLKLDDSTIGNAPSEGVSGAIYTPKAITDSNVNVKAGDLFPYLYKSDDNTPRTTLHQMVRAYMATNRKAARKIEFTCLSNQVRFSDLLSIKDQGRYIQLNNEYDMRNCQQKITAVELNKDFLPDSNTEATADQDTYETYPTY